MNTAFSHALRVVLCPACAEPVHASTAAGEVACKGCGESFAIGDRLDQEESSALDEPERLAKLAEQDGSPLRPPKEVAALVQEGELSEERVQEATDMWQATRLGIGDEAGENRDDLERRFYFLTRLLYERLIEKEEELRVRAILETAIEVSRSRRYRQTFRCMLACEAARGDDATSAEEWLAPCDPRSDDIHADSVYRYSAAYVATHKRQWAKVIDVLGATHGDAPLAAAFDATCSVLRAHAHERRQDVSAAVYELVEAMKRLPGGVDDVDRVLRTNGSLKLCRRSYGKARKRLGGGDEAKGSVAPVARQRVEMRKVLPWTVLSLACFGLAVGMPAGATLAGVPLSYVLVGLGIVLAAPIAMVLQGGR